MATGKKTGGRRKGTQDRQNAGSGELPLDYMLRVMRDPTADPPRRDAMACSAAPYCHPQLQAVAHKLVDAAGNPIAPVVNLSVSTPKLEDRSAKLTYIGAKDGDSVPPPPKPQLTSIGPKADDTVQ
jgi:hypothetical protein